MKRALFSFYLIISAVSFCFAADPIDGNRYNVETLEVRGFLLFFSGVQYWQRCTREEAMLLH
ncbi:MAG: DUF2147 domain-containing protein [Treponema sp.]|jgi:hypothetical protein|nr:DUF2147 domain-containing protein [Treponema sp.]